MEMTGINVILIPSGYLVVDLEFRIVNIMCKIGSTNNESSKLHCLGYMSN